jgi:hypothetical protein
VPNPTTAVTAIRYDRHQEHFADAVLLLERLRRASREGIYPSTAELQAEGKFGLRPVNRLVDLRGGKYNRTRYDIERLNCGHGIFRWRLHEPARPGYPKDRNQTVLQLKDKAGDGIRCAPSAAAATNSQDWYERQTGRPRATAVAPPALTTGLPLFDAAVRR